MLARLSGAVVPAVAVNALNGTSAFADVVPTPNSSPRKQEIKMRTILAAVFSVILLTATQAVAEGMKHEGVMVEQPWARASAGQAKAGAAFMTIVNMGPHADRLIAAKSDLAARTELHTHLMEGGVMKMRQVDGIDVAPGTPTELQPGGYHVMFMGLKKPFIEGETLPLTLIFEKAGPMNVDFVVQGAGAKQAHGAKTPHQH